MAVTRAQTVTGQCHWAELGQLNDVQGWPLGGRVSGAPLKPSQPCLPVPLASHWMALVMSVCPESGYAPVL